MRTVVDTNVWVSAVVKPAGGCARILDAYRAERFELVISEPLLAEVGMVLTRPRFSSVFNVTTDDAAELVRVLGMHSRKVEVTGRAHGCRDPKDDIVIETALRGGAIYIVSGDHDLTADEQLQQYLALGGVRVLTVREFLLELDGEPTAGE